LPTCCNRDQEAGKAFIFWSTDPSSVSEPNPNSIIYVLYNGEDLTNTVPLIILGAVIFLFLIVFAKRFCGSLFAAI